MRISEMAELAGVTVRTVRYYHQINLLPLPEAGHGWRNYGLAHVARLMRVRWLVDSGVPLAQAKELLALEHVEHPKHVHLPTSAAHRTEDPDDGPRSEVAADLRAVLAGVDQQLEDLAAQRSHLAALLDTVEGGGPLTPVPAALTRMYQELARRAPTEKSRRLIHGEWDLLELTCYRMDLPDDVVDFVERLTDEDLDRMVQFIDSFQRIADTRPPDAEQRIRQQAREVAEFTERIAADLIPRWASMFADGRYAWAWKAFALVFPSHYFRIYAEAIADEFGVELSAEDRRALEDWGRSAAPNSTNPNGTAPDATDLNSAPTGPS